jgi:hypothetical protein
MEMKELQLEIMKVMYYLLEVLDYLICIKSLLFLCYHYYQQIQFYQMGLLICN